MSSERITVALRDATDTRNILIEDGALGAVASVFEQNFGGRAAVVVADENTWAVAGEEVQRRLVAAGRKLVEPYIFPGRPVLYAEYANIAAFGASLAAHDAIPIAVGSGTLNDIVKRSSHECDRPYLCVATAASMDGYTAFGASISRDGQKQTLACPAPTALLADVDVLARAPASMAASGYADLLGKVTAGADWIVADALEVERISPEIWSLVQDPLREWIGDPSGLRSGDSEALALLIEGLVMSGLAMQAAASSRPASGCEHQFSHLWEMEGLGRKADPPLSHGFKVGVGSVAIAALYERILQRDLSGLDIEARVRDWPARGEVERTVRAAHATPGLDEAAVRESLAKHISSEDLAGRLTLLRECWPKLRDRLAGQVIAAGRLRESLRAAGCPTGPGEIGLRREDFKATYARARMIRRRYTVLDLASEAGILDECVEELFAPGGFWAHDVRAERGES